MRLRNKPWAQKLVVEHPEAILNEPDPEKKINWEERFDDFSKPLAIEIGSGKGQFITTLAKKHPKTNLKILILLKLHLKMKKLKFQIVLHLKIRLMI